MSATPLPFTAEYATLPDYIIGITERIWEQRGLGLIRRWYGAQCLMHTAFGDFAGVETVVSGTAETLHSFPDRRLLGEDVIYNGGVAGNGYSSHRIVSTMHHRGDGSFGEATGRACWARTVADCLIEDGVITEEWLVRDQAAIAIQLGIDPAEWGRQRAGVMAVEDAALPDPDAQPEIEAVLDGRDAGSAMGQSLLRIFNDADLAEIGRLCDPAVNAHLPRGETAFGHGGLDGWVMSYLAAFPDARMTVEHVITRNDPGQATRVALRWRIAATHSGRGGFGAPSGARLHIPGITHLEVVNNKVTRVFFLVDELAIWTGIGLRIG
jgi:predicted ester cyclase